MQELSFQNMEVKKSREEKIREAKHLFQKPDIFSSFSRSREEEETDGKEPAGEKRHYGIYRFLSAFTLLAVLLLSFHFQFSYRGWNREKIEKVLSDDSHYQKLVRQAEMVIKRIGPKGN